MFDVKEKNDVNILFDVKQVFDVKQIFDVKKTLDVKNVFDVKRCLTSKQKMTSKVSLKEVVARAPLAETDLIIASAGLGDRLWSGLRTLDVQQIFDVKQKNEVNICLTSKKKIMSKFCLK